MDFCRWVIACICDLLPVCKTGPFHLPHSDMYAINSILLFVLALRYLGKRYSKNFDCISFVRQVYSDYYSFLGKPFVRFADYDSYQSSAADKVLTRFERNGRIHYGLKFGFIVIHNSGRSFFATQGVQVTILGVMLKYYKRL